jgi:glutamyl-tRNA reductase
MVIVDLAVPADVERPAGDIEGVRLFDVDDLRAGLDESMSARLREVPKVEAIIEEEVEAFGRRYRELEVEPLLSELRRQAESIREREVARALRDLGDLDDDVVERVEVLSRSLVKKLLHDPTVRPANAQAPVRRTRSPTQFATCSASPPRRTGDGSAASRGGDTRHAGFDARTCPDRPRGGVAGGSAPWSRMRNTRDLHRR